MWTGWNWKFIILDISKTLKCRALEYQVDYVPSQIELGTRNTVPHSDKMDNLHGAIKQTLLQEPNINIVEVLCAEFDLEILNDTRYQLFYMAKDFYV